MNKLINRVTQGKIVACSTVLNLALVMGSTAFAVAPAPEKYPIHKSLNDVGISVDIYLTHVLEADKDTPAWCYKTTGLSATGQKEMVVTVLKDANKPDEACPEEPIQFLGGIANSFKRGAFLSAGQVADLHGRAFLVPSMVGMLFVRTDVLPDVPGASGCLSAVPITQEEISVADLVGSTRLLGALARQSRYFPCPLWCNRKRSSVFSLSDIAEMKEDPLIRGAGQTRSDASFMTEGKKCSLLIRAATAQKLGDAMLAKKNAGLRVSLAIDPRANAFLIWVPHGGAPFAVAEPGSSGSKMSGQFLALIPEQKADKCVQIQDGFALFATTETWNKLANALKDTQQLSIPLSESTWETFSLEVEPLL